MNEHGAKSMNQSMDKPKSTPRFESTKNQAMQPSILASSVPVWTEAKVQRGGGNMTDHCRCDCGTFIANVPREFCHCISTLAYKFGKRISEYTLRPHTEEAVTLVVRVLKATAVCRTVGWWVGGFYTPVWNTMLGCSAVKWAEVTLMTTFQFH